MEKENNPHPTHPPTQALARLRFDDAVNVADVEEAIRLTRMSKVPVSPTHPLPPSFSSIHPPTHP